MEFEGVKNTAPLPRDFSRVKLTLDNVLLDDEKLKISPSMIDGISKDDEISLRILGCELIQTAGILLKLPQTAMATGQIIFHRFYYSKSFVKHNYEIVAMSSVYSAAKIEEAPRRLRDVLNVFHHIKQVRSKKAIKPMVLDSNYVHVKSQVIKAERRMLKELGFCVHVKHPHKIVVSYLQILGLVENTYVTQYAWNLMNDSLRSDVFVRYSPEAIACSCIFLSARRSRIPLPNNPPWYQLFGVGLDSIEAISRMVLYLYTLPKPDQERLEKLCEETKQQQLEEKRKARVGLPSLDGTPNSLSRTDSPKVYVSPSANMVRKKTEDTSRVVENGSSEEKNGQKGKRRLEDSERSHSQSLGSGSHSRSRSSRSRSLSPPPLKKKKRSHSPVRRHKRDRGYDDYDDYYYSSSSRDKRSHKHKKRLRSHSPSQSPVGRYYPSSKAGKKYPGKEKRRSYSPLQDKGHRSRKHRNGQRDLSPRYDKYRR